MKLFHALGACSKAVHVAMLEIDTHFDAVALYLTVHMSSEGDDYFATSDRGYVTLLPLNDGSHHTQFASLLQCAAYLDSQHRLIGDIGSRRLEVIKWSAFIGSELLKIFCSWLWQKENAKSSHQVAKRRLATRFDDVDQLPATRRNFACNFSVAGAYAFTKLNWADFAGFSIKAFRHLKTYLVRIGKCPKAQMMMHMEGLTK